LFVCALPCLEARSHHDFLSAKSNRWQWVDASDRASHEPIRLWSGTAEFCSDFIGSENSRILYTHEWDFARDLVGVEITNSFLRYFLRRKRAGLSTQASDKVFQFPLLCAETLLAASVVSRLATTTTSSDNLNPRSVRLEAQQIQNR
jgi:hypothetical protein